VLPVAPMIRTFTSPALRAVVLFVNYLYVSLFLADWESLRARAPPFAARFCYSKADIPSGRLIVYIGERVQADGKGFSRRRTVRVRRDFPIGSFPHTADLVA
jgi:hypothetical protein